MFMQPRLLGTALLAAAAADAIALAASAAKVREPAVETLDRMPLTGAWLLESQIRRRAPLLGTLLGIRVPLLRALEHSARALKRQRPHAHLEQAQGEIRRRRPLARCRPPSRSRAGSRQRG